jgi:hypothetical protein
LPAQTNAASLPVRLSVGGRGRNQKVLYYNGLAEGVSTRAPEIFAWTRCNHAGYYVTKKSATEDGGAKTFPPQEEVNGK